MDKTELKRIIEQVIDEKMFSMSNLAIPNHLHNSYDSNQLDPAVSLLGFPVLQVTDASTTPTDSPIDGIFRFYVDSTGERKMWVYTVVNDGAVLTGEWRCVPLLSAITYSSVSTSTNSTTPVNVFGTTVPFNGIITGIYVISKDTTAGNITIASTAGTIATIAKGTVAGVMVGAVSLTNTSFSSGNTFTVVSSSAGEAFVIINFQPN